MDCDTDHQVVDQQIQDQDNDADDAFLTPEAEQENPLIRSVRKDLIHKVGLELVIRTVAPNEHLRLLLL